MIGVGTSAMGSRRIAVWRVAFLILFFSLTDVSFVHAARKPQAMFVKVEGAVLILDEHGWGTHKPEVRDKLYIGQSVITGPFNSFGSQLAKRGYATLMLPKGGELRIGPKSRVVIGDLWAEAEQAEYKKASFRQKIGILLYRAGRWIKDHQSNFDLQEPYGAVGTSADYVDHEGTVFTVSTAQKIAFVHGNDLWLMNDDGSGATNFIAAPGGCRMGRSAFSPDGATVVYEALSGGSIPNHCDLYVADGDGSNPQVLVSAGPLNEVTGRPLCTYSARLAAGPSFSPDGSQVSFVRVQHYDAGTLYRLRQKEVCTVPVSGGSVRVLWKTVDVAGGYTDYDVGENTCWLDNGDIAFIRSGAMGAHFSAIADATDTNKTSWPCELYVEFDSENGFNPTRLNVSVAGAGGGNLAGQLVGYGLMTPTSLVDGWNWYSWPQDSGWLTPQAGAWYGPLKFNMTEGDHAASVTAGDGQLSITVGSAIHVTKGARIEVASACGGYYTETTEGGVWVIHPGSETPRQVTREICDSLAWGSDRSFLMTEYADFGTQPSTSILLYDENGFVLADARLGDGTRSSMGNWDETGRRALAWCGSNDTGRIYLLDVDTESKIDLGEGRYPVFAPKFRTEVACYEDWVSVRDTNTDHKVIAQTGQIVIDDDLQNGGQPQDAVALAAPWVASVSPPAGSAVCTSSSLQVSFQFAVPVQTNSVLSNWVSGVTWPVSGGNDESAFELNATAYALRMADTNASFSGKLHDLIAAGKLAATWDTARTQLTVAVASGALQRVPGMRGEIRFDFSEAIGTNGQTIAFGDAVTQFEFANPVGPTGGVVASAAGGRLIVPSGALSGNAALTLTHERKMLFGSLPVGNWRQASGAYTVSPTNVSLAANVTVSLPAAGSGGDLSVWCLAGTTWTNLGGAYNATDGTMTVSTRLLGTFVVLYNAPAVAALRLSKSCDETSAATGETVRFELRLDNIGRTIASNVVVTDIIPTTLEDPTNFIPTAVYSSATHTVVWSLGALTAESARALSFEARVAATAVYGSVITNRASASATGLSATNSNAALLRCGRPVAAMSRFGIADIAASNRAAIAALGLRLRRGVATITTTQAQDPSLINWTAFDNTVRSNQSAGLSTYGVLNLTSVAGIWPQPFEFAAAVGVYVERYDGDGLDDMPGLTNAIHVWELFDQFAPDTNAWVGCGLEQYGIYLLAAQAAAHDRDPNAAVVNSGGEWVQPSGTPGYLVNLLTNLPGAADGMDAVCVADFWERTDCASTDTAWRTQYLQTMDLFHTLAGSPVAHLPAWLTRADFHRTFADLQSKGYTCANRDLSLFLARAVPFAFGRGVSHLAYSTLQIDAGADQATRWGALMDTNGHRREAFYVLQSMIGRLEGFQRASLSDLGGADIGVLFVTSSNQPLWVVWNSSNRASLVRLPVGPVGAARVASALPATYNDTSAAWTISTNAVANGMVALTVSGTPVYVEAIGNFSFDLDGDGIPNDQDDDMDGDGMPNAYEEAHNLNPFVNDALDDADGDGMLNVDEYRAGADPQDASKNLDLMIVGQATNGITLKWQAVSGVTYRVRWSPDLRTWSNANEGLYRYDSATGAWFDSGPPRTPAPPSAVSNRFYRVQCQP